MQLVVDTNILLYCVNSDCDEHARARGFLKAHLESALPWSLTWGIVYEFLRVSTHARVFPCPLQATQALTFLKSLFANDSLTILSPTERHVEMLAQTVQEMSHAAGNIFHDVTTAVIMREYGIREIVTADTDFLQFNFLTAKNPLLD